MHKTEILLQILFAPSILWDQLENHFELLSIIMSDLWIVSFKPQKTQFHTMTLQKFCFYLLYI